ncbi:MAG TPA: SUMF1/EgtB/PvdO family nonheme iron enzyme, partial [Anaerolineales bacterium]|nr:SUMF1/EgtB/PvdO family nonheme iron enzyme [Anaerolineales bacterium]
FKGFRFGTPALSDTLTGKLRNLGRYNGLNVHEDYFDEAMHRLRTQYLSIPLETVLHPVSTEVQKVVREEQVAADRALEQIEDVKELVKQVDETVDQLKAKSKSQREKPVLAVDIPVPSEEIAGGTDTVSKNESVKQKRATRLKTQESPVPREVTERPSPSSNFNFRLVGGVAGGLLIIGFLIWGTAKLLGNSPPVTPELTGTLQVNMALSSQPTTTITSQPSATIAFQSEPTNTISSTEITISATATALGIGSTLTGNDGMTLLYVPAGEFTMGNNNDGVAEKPAHTVYLDAFWIDKTEVTNRMYYLCVMEGTCKEPTAKNSVKRYNYYGNSVYDNYPVIYIGRNMSKTYCEWVGRRLPTEAEWEKAARGTDERTYPWGNSLPNDHLLNTSIEDVTEVGKYPDGASPYGVLDMAGNVWEWVADWYSDKYYASSPDSNPLGPNSGQYRVLRGGSFPYHLMLDPGVASTIRYQINPTSVNANIGFRCAMDTNP